MFRVPDSIKLKVQNEASFCLRRPLIHSISENYKMFAKINIT